MQESDVAILKAGIDMVVKLRCTDGEIIMAKIDLVDEEVGEVVYEMISTNRESKYSQSKGAAAYLIHFEEIATVEPEGSVRTKD